MRPSHPRCVHDLKIISSYWHCRLGICFHFCWAWQTNPSNNLMVRRAGLSLLAAWWTQSWNPPWYLRRWSPMYMKIISRKMILDVHENHLRSHHLDHCLIWDQIWDLGMNMISHLVIVAAWFTWNEIQEPPSWAGWQNLPTHLE